nr:PREDICTED: odorant receptor Or2 [Tribolium castaneum]|eukprot:XP_015838120.1 PREDICTED: odorant receptor Or2 [Tribolium castaneum]
MLTQYFFCSFAKKCNNYLNWILFMQFFVSTISIGITMFQLTVVRPFSNEFYSLFTYISAIIGQIFMYCWYGNEVEVKSNKIPQAIFESGWTDFPLKTKKDLVFLLMKTREPIKVSAFNLFSLSLDTFMRILRTSWSYFALLNQVT